MSGKECFGVIVRTAGLSLILMGGYNIISSGYVAMTPERAHQVTAAWGSVFGLLFVLVGLLLLRGAPALLNFAYPPEPLSRQAGGESDGLDTRA